MREGKWLAALALGLVLAAPAVAQQQSGGSILGFSNLNNLTNQIITPNSSNSPVPIAQPQTFTSPSGSLLKFFPTLSRRNNSKPMIGSSTFPTPDQLPGKDYLNAFRFQKPPRVQP
jgi:hypothetical protein